MEGEDRRLWGEVGRKSRGRRGGRGGWLPDVYFEGDGRGRAGQEKEEGQGYNIYVLLGTRWKWLKGGRER